MAVVDVAGLTEQQRAAVLHDGSVGLSAGAGCGKTHVLTQRFLRHLAESPHAAGEDVAHAAANALQSVVAITFTDRAAREMRDRLRRRLGELSRERSADQAYWKAVYLQFEHARVGTFHAFCGAVLRNEAATLGLDPDFAQLDEAQAAALLREAVDDELRSRLARADSEEHAETIDLLHELGLRKLRSAAIEFARVDADRWSRIPESTEELANRWRDAIELYLHEPLRDAVRSAARDFLELLRPGGYVTEYWRKSGPVLAALLPELIEGEPTDDVLATVVDAAQPGRYHQQSKKEWGEDYPIIRDAAQLLRDAVKALQSLDPPTQEQLAEHAEFALKLVRFADGVRRGYAERKAATPGLDFEDLLAMTRTLLTDPDQQSARKRLARPIRLLLVDEFQDTNPIQAELVRALCESELAAGKLFFVGDFKQSIYRFRGAEPDVFHDYRREIGVDGRLPLSGNFRSRPEIVRFANLLFEDAFVPGEDASLSPQRESAGPSPNIEFMWPRDDEQPDDDKKQDAAAARRIEGRWIARRIRQLVDDGEVAVPERGGDERPCRWGDVCILFRSLTNIRWYEEALREHEIPYYLVGGKAFYSLQEIADVMHLLRAIQDPNDEVALFGALRSPLFAVDDAAIYRLAQHERGLSGGFRAACPRGLSQEQQQRVVSAQEVFAELVGLKDRTSPAELLQTALARTAYDAALLAEFLGERQLANVTKLVDLARSFGPGSGLTLADFIEQLEDSVAEQPREAPAAILPESADVVRLMTVHQAKGLEFPIVFLPDLAARPQGGQGAAVGFHDAFGPVVLQGEGAAAQCVKEAFNAREAVADRAERRRVFYVAVTRASERLVLSAAHDAEKHLSGERSKPSTTECWIDLLAERFELNTGACRDAPDDAPTIRVICEEPDCVAAPEVESQRKLRQALQTIDGAAAPPQTLHTGPLPPRGAALQRFSFSQLSGELERRPIEAEAHEPNGRKADALQLGSLVHAALESFPWTDAPLSERIRRLADEQQFDAGPREEAERLLSAFAQTPLAAEMLDSRRRRHELEFLLRLPRGLAADDAIDVQGYIDCLYQDASGAWRLVDFKTNRTTAEGVAAAAEPYLLQMYLYGEAARRVLGDTPRLTLHFLRPGVSFDAPAWEKLAEERLPELRRAVAAARDRLEAEE